MTRRLPSSSALSIAALAFASLVGAGTADAGRFSGGVRFSGGFHGSVRVGGGFAARPSYGGTYRSYGSYGSYGHVRDHRSWGVHGHVYVGGSYGYYPSYYYYYPEYVPSYYGAYYYPVQPAYTAPGVTAVVAPRPPLPRLGVGLFGGIVDTDYNTATNTKETDVGVLARYRLTEGLIIEGELGKVSTSVTNVDGTTTDNARVDRRLGGTLIYEIGAYNALAPYGLVGMGVQQASVNGDYSTTQDYAEIGAGLRLALSRNFHLTFDIRAGQRTSVSSSGSPQMLPPNTTASVVAPPQSNSADNSEDYTRARLTAILYF